MANLKTSPERSLLKRPGGISKTGSSVKKFHSLNESKSSREKEKACDNTIFRSSNIQFTKIGICYVPSEEEFPQIPVNVSKQICDTNKPDYHQLLKEDYSSLIVLIIGDLILADEFQTELEKTQKLLSSSSKIICKQTIAPSLENIIGVDFFIFLLELDKIYCINETRARLSETRHHLKNLSCRALLVDISSSLGPQADVCSPEDLHNLLVEFQIPSIKFSFVDRSRKKYVMKKIISTMNYSCQGNTAGSMIQWGLTCPTRLNDLLLT